MKRKEYIEILKKAGIENCGTNYDFILCNIVIANRALAEKSEKAGGKYAPTHLREVADIIDRELNRIGFYDK